MNVAYRGVNAFFTWANATYLDSKLLTAIIITGVGLTAYVIGSCWPQVLGAEAKTRRTMLTERRETKKAGIGVISGATTPPNNPATLGLNGTLPLTPGTTPGWSSPTSSLEPSSATEDEIDAILRRHGIQ
jgi:hypothetical protein